MLCVAATASAPATNESLRELPEDSQWWRRTYAWEERFGIRRRSRFLQIGGLGGERAGKFEREEIEVGSQLCLCAAEEGGGGGGAGILYYEEKGGCTDTDFGGEWR